MLEVGLWTEEQQIGSLFFDADHLRRVTSVVPDRICVSQLASSQYHAASKLIESTYGQCYGSTIRHHYPLLMSVQGRRGEVLAAVGIRRAAEERLFLEQYLDSTVEQCINDATGEAVDRDKIVEIGNLSSVGRGASSILFMGLAAYLKQRGYTHAAVTATKQLRTSFERFGFSWVTLAPAVADALPDAGTSWGSYYEREPEVLAGRIAPCFTRLEKFLPRHRNGEVCDVFSQVHPMMSGCAE